MNYPSNNIALLIILLIILFYCSVYGSPVIKVILFSGLHVLVIKMSMKINPIDSFFYVSSRCKENLLDIYAVQLHHGRPYFIWQSHINNYVMINSTFKFKTFKFIYSPDIRVFCEVLKIEAFIVLTLCSQLLYIPDIVTPKPLKKCKLLNAVWSKSPAKCCKAH